MNKLKIVTITGADDYTDPEKLAELSQEFPFVEWGILVSRRQEDSMRFPSRAWIRSYVNLAKTERLRTSVHICGSWVREFLVGNIDWNQLPPRLLEIACRTQINTHAKPHTSTIGMFRSMTTAPEPCISEHEIFRNWIFQLDGVNDHLYYAARGQGVIARGLHDLSHGVGLLPKAWPQAQEYLTGYAGGLGPENIETQLGLIDDAADVYPYWIDMESRVRTEDGLKLDLSKVRVVLEYAKKLKKNV